MLRARHASVASIYIYIIYGEVLISLVLAYIKYLLAIIGVSVYVASNRRQRAREKYASAAIKQSGDIIERGKVMRGIVR